MTNKQLAERLSRILDQLETIGENDMGNLPARCAGNYHKAVDALRTAHFWITSVAEEEAVS